MGPLLGPLVYLYTGPTIGATCIFIYGAHYGGPIVYIWVWFFINKNMIKIEK